MRARRASTETEDFGARKKGGLGKGEYEWGRSCRRQLRLSKAQDSAGADAWRWNFAGMGADKSGSISK